MQFRARSPLPYRNWGSLSQKAINELFSPPGKSKGVRFLATIGGFLSHKPITPSHKSQTAGWLYAGTLFLEGDWLAPLDRDQTSGTQVPGSPIPHG